MSTIALPTRPLVEGATEFVRAEGERTMPHAIKALPKIFNEERKFCPNRFPYFSVERNNMLLIGPASLSNTASTRAWSESARPQNAVLSLETSQGGTITESRAAQRGKKQKQRNRKV